MQVDKEKLKKFMVEVTRILKMLETDLLTYQAVFLALRQTLGAKEMDHLLAEAKRTAGIEKLMNEKYDVQLEQRLKRFDQIQTEQDFLTFLNKWTPTTKPN